jgi:hypothetical protein
VFIWRQVRSTAQQKQQTPVSQETEADRRMWDKGSIRTQPEENGRTTTMLMYMTLTLMAGLISVMFVATAVSSIVNAVREDHAARDALSRASALQF